MSLPDADNLEITVPVSAKPLVQNLSHCYDDVIEQPDGSKFVVIASTGRPYEILVEALEDYNIPSHQKFFLSTWWERYSYRLDENNKLQSSYVSHDHAVIDPHRILNAHSLVDLQAEVQSRLDEMKETPFTQGEHMHTKGQITMYLLGVKDGQA